MGILDEVFDKSTDAVFGVDIAGRVLFTNSTFERLLGYSHNQLSIGNNAREKNLWKKLNPRISMT